MFIRQCYRVKNGKRHAYWALVESYRAATGPRQRVVAWLGKLDEAGRLGVEAAAFGSKSSDTQRTFFEEADDSVEPRWIEVNSSAIRVENCRQFGGPWLAMELIRKLQLDEFLTRVMRRGRKTVSQPQSPSHRLPWSSPSTPRANLASEARPRTGSHSVVPLVVPPVENNGTNLPSCWKRK